jgi:hypothetical protein
MNRQVKEVLMDIEHLAIPSDMDERVSRYRSSDLPPLESPTASSMRSRLGGLAVGLSGLILVVVVAVSLAPGDDESMQNPVGLGVVEIACTEQGPVVSESRLVAGPRGVAIAITNRSAATATLTVDDIVVKVNPGTHRMTLPIPPGPAIVDCLADNFAGTADYSSEAISVADPRGYWMASFFDCPGASIGTSPSFYNPPREGNPVDLARDDFAGTLPEDVFTRVEYSDNETAVVLVQRDGSYIARLSYVAARDGKWEYSGGLECDL